MNFILSLLFTLSFLPLESFAKAKVAFLEFYDPKGNLVVLEPGGRFGHVAISYKGGWLHSFPPRPVEWVKDISQFGVVGEILEVDTHPLLNEDFIFSELGKKSTVQSHWEDPLTTYCSKLVGKILGIPPRPTNWKAHVWEKMNQYAQSNSEFGLSPDDIYEHLTINQNQPDNKIKYIYSGSCNQALH